ncbi:unnamed protein product [Sphenostylis stenocarpa]|uniref:Uncharacterized protein n=1 Tax=Sphenostylis stenocarpa TaxID=92480 RepID=A0AA86V6D5_9FABA|nr:unnamed protein product [Sphenostylis stenocarpa]
MSELGQKVSIKLANQLVHLQLDLLQAASLLQSNTRLLSPLTLNYLAQYTFTGAIGLVPRSIIFALPDPQPLPVHFLLLFAQLQITQLLSLRLGPVAQPIRIMYTPLLKNS